MIKMQECFSKYKAQIILIVCGLIASFLCWSRVHFFTFFFGDFAVRYFDTDDFMTIVRIRDFFENFDLADNIIKRANFPYGGDMHWTRIYDFFLISPSYILNFFFDIKKATEYVGLLISPAVKCVLIVVVYELMKKISQSKTAAFLTTLLIALHPAINYTNMFARPDHHAFTMLMMALYLLFLAECCENNFRNNLDNIKVGIVSALNLWTTPETLMLLLLTSAVIFLYAYDDREKMLAVARQCAYTAASISVIVVVFRPFEVSTILFLIFSAAAIAAIYKKIFWLAAVLGAVAICSVFNTLPVEYDKISIVHLILYIAMTCFFAGSVKFDDFWKKCVVGGILGIAFLALFPKFFYGMEAGISDALREAWFANDVDEMKSPFSFDSTVVSYFVVYIVISVIAIYDKIQRLVAKQKESYDLMWWILIASCFCYIIFSCIADRLRATLAFFSIPLIVEFGFHGTFSKFLSENLKIILVCLLSIGSDVTQKYYPILRLFFMEGADGFIKFCEMHKDAYEQEDRFFKVLDGISQKPITVFTYLGKAAPTLYYTKHNVVATPYHRHEQGIIAFNQVMQSPYNEPLVKEIFKKTKTDYVFVSKGMTYSSQRYMVSFAGMIARGSCPGWADIAEIPFEFSDVILLKLNRDML